MFLGTPVRLIAGALFSAFLAAAALSDLRTRRIPNRLVAAQALVGLLLASTLLADPVGLRQSVYGLLLGFGLWVPLWLVGVLGAGDVKLAAACGAWLGPVGVLDASLLGMLIGGVLAAIVLVRRRTVVGSVSELLLWTTALRHDTRLAVSALVRSEGENSAALLPYGVALAVGAALAGWLPAAWLPLTR